MNRKGCRKGFRGTKDRFFIAPVVLRPCKQRQNNLRMEWIEFKSAYDMLSYSWVGQSLKILVLLITLLILCQEACPCGMPNLYAGNQHLGSIPIKRCLFEGDSFSPGFFFFFFFFCDYLDTNFDDVARDRHWVMFRKKGP